jgi:hypothetical protein
LPVLQIRRFHRGWRYLVAMGYGTQRDSSSKWRPSRYLDLQLATPPAGQLQLAAGILYSNTPVSTGYVYDYLQGSLALTSRF